VLYRIDLNLSRIRNLFYANKNVHIVLLLG
jgi:hypothetical protein